MDLFFILCAKYLFVVPFMIAGIFFLKQERGTQVKIVMVGISVAIISYGIALLLGWIYFDPRPFVVGHFKPLIDHDTENGFPSDHVLLVATVSAVLTIFSRKLSFWCWLCTILIAFARVYVGVHHPIDVLASIFIAITVTLSVQLLFPKFITSLTFLALERTRAFSRATADTIKE